ncbi:pentapeptide repeat-containing protein [Streptomyces sp. NPDC102441]|uniref:pentapeptide repeat-containing protein n=1 Tax=Streptomyces sp. NPDC102441 TaxID=3366176 RepID=UPI0038154B59
MTHPGPASPPTSHTWPHCGHGATLEDTVGCSGAHVPGRTECLAHVDDTDRAAYLAGLAPGADLDHRGTTFTEPLLRVLLNALHDPATGGPRFGHVRFDSAVFEGMAGFWLSTFEGPAGFESATFQDDARFQSATFEHVARFGSATVHGIARFESVTFRRDADFESATFKRDARFMSATFTRDAHFESATFTSDGAFGSAIFQYNAIFTSATFERSARFRLALFELGAQFGSATFKGHAQFGSAMFQDRAWFQSAIFQGDVWFDATIFQANATFDAAIFQGVAWFEAIFQGPAQFSSATFQGRAGFGSTAFQGFALFDSVNFQDIVRFDSVIFESDALFEGTVFERPVSMGPLVCAGRIRLSGAVFCGPATLLFAVRRLECRRTRWSSMAELRLRYAQVDFSHAVLEHPLTMSAEADPFVLHAGQPMAEPALAGTPDASVRVASIRGVDAAHLVLADIDLSECLFTGTVHLDQLRLEGACSFDSVPAGTHRQRWRPVRFTRRRTLAEEHHWRAHQPGAAPGWNTAVLGSGRVGPLQLAPVYRALRKAFEDGKHEPGAADFYYGEMEMRRHAHDIPQSERFLLTSYWALSGYGLRASRALAWLAASMLVTIVLMMGFGLPQGGVKQEATGTVPPRGGKVTFEIDMAAPRNPTGDRFTGERFEKALNGTLNSVVFRSSGQNLTTAGKYIEMMSRVAEPILLGLAVLAVRNRVKR